MTKAVEPRPTGAVVQDFTPPPPPGPDRITGRTVALERLDADAHAAEIWQAAQGADWIWDYLGYGPFHTADDYHAWAAKSAAGKDPFFYAIRDLASGKTVGVASYLRIEPAHGVIEIGHIMMTPALQQTVAATEALFLMIDWPIKAGYRRVEWKCDSLNGPSIRAAHRLGFTFEGVFRQHMIYKGRNRDSAWLSITDSEWPALRAAHEEWLDPANFGADGQQKLSLSQLTDKALPRRN